MKFYEKRCKSWTTGHPSDAVTLETSFTGIYDFTNLRPLEFEKMLHIKMLCSPDFGLMLWLQTALKAMYILTLIT